MALEKTHENAGNRYAKKFNWQVYKLSFPGIRGAPDRLYAHKRHGAHFVEWKRPGKEPTEQQLKRRMEMRAAGLSVMYFDRVETFMAWIDGFEDTGL